MEQARATPRGQKKDYSGDMPKAYDPKIVEAATYVCKTYMRSATKQVCAVATLQTFWQCTRHADNWYISAQGLSAAQICLVGGVRLLQAR